MIRLVNTSFFLSTWLSAWADSSGTMLTVLESEATRNCIKGSIVCEDGDRKIGRSVPAQRLVVGANPEFSEVLEYSIARPRPRLVIYFDFDSSDVGVKFDDVLREFGSYLAENDDARVRIAGHADERGDRRYNIDLGERRAHAVRRVLVLHGAEMDQLETVGYGEERPAAIDGDERSYSLNRRVEVWPKDF